MILSPVIVRTRVGIYPKSGTARVSPGTASFVFAVWTYVHSSWLAIRRRRTFFLAGGHHYLFTYFYFCCCISFSKPSACWPMVNLPSNARCFTYVCTYVCMSDCCEFLFSSCCYIRYSILINRRRMHHVLAPQVARRLRGPLDDDRRAVRQAAAEARNIWFLLG